MVRGRCTSVIADPSIRSARQNGSNSARIQRHPQLLGKRHRIVLLRTSRFQHSARICASVSRIQQHKKAQFGRPRLSRRGNI